MFLSKIGPTSIRQIRLLLIYLEKGKKCAQTTSLVLPFVIFFFPPISSQRPSSKEQNSSRRTCLVIRTGTRIVDRRKPGTFRVFSSRRSRLLGMSAISSTRRVSFAERKATKTSVDLKKLFSISRA